MKIWIEGVRPHHVDQLGQRHLDVDGDLLAVVDGRSDQLVVALGGQELTHQSFLDLRTQGSCTHARTHTEERDLVSSYVQPIGTCVK